MKLKTVTNLVTSKVGRQMLVAQKHSPTALYAVGVVGVVATAVLASRATLKMDEILKENEENKLKIQAAQDTKSKDYTEEDAQQDSKVNTLKTAVKIARVYTPAVVVGVATVGALTGSHFIMRKRYAGLSAAYALLDKGFKDYRARVVEELGVEKDREFRFGVVEREIGVETDEGVVPKTIKEHGVDANGRSMYARLFDQTNKHWQRQGMYNQMTLQAQQQYANDRLNRDGYLFLNDVYESLGFERTNYGQVVGWIKNGNGDSYVDFGFFNDSYEGKRFVAGYNDSIWLDFNVDGTIWDKI